MTWIINLFLFLGGCFTGSFCMLFALALANASGEYDDREDQTIDKGDNENEHDV